MVVCKIPAICPSLNELVWPSGTTVCKVAPINTILSHAWHTGQQSIIQWEMTCFVNPYMKTCTHQLHYTHDDLILWSTEIQYCFQSRVNTQILCIFKHDYISFTASPNGLVSRDSPAQKMYVPKGHATQIFMCLYAFLCAFWWHPKFSKRIV